MICPICNQTLIKQNNSYICKNQHNFDIAKTGYVNLLINQPNSGDNKLMIDARNRVLESGYFQKLVDLIVEELKKHQFDSIIDIGCGEGYYTRALKNEFSTRIVGIDISKYGCLKASKLSKDIEYVVCSVTKLPFADNEFSGIINIFAPHNEQEYNRICSDWFIKVIPNKKHLLELKEIIYQEVIIKESKEPVFKLFKKIKSFNLCYQVFVDNLVDFMQMTPYYYKSKIDNLDFPNLYLTLDMKIILYKKVT